jgi:hypothetical protein
MEDLDKKEGKAPSDKVKGAKKKACGGDCIAPTICKDVFQGDCALEIMSEKTRDSGKPGTTDSAPGGKY